MFTSKLLAALEWAQRGFRVFPLEPNGKSPAIMGFTSAASSDPSVITAWWRDPLTGQERDYNIGVLTTGMVVVDIDVKKDKPGLDNYFGLGGHFETLTVQTPSGGYHCYFFGRDSSNTSDFPARGVDIRSHNGYVVAPGSVIDGAVYRIIVDCAMCEVPAAIASSLRDPLRRKQEEANVELDSPNAIAHATRWLADAPLAIQGCSGDVTTYQVACRLVRDFALSVDVAFGLLIDNWNERCSPPWEPEQLWCKVENANQYGTGEQGAALPSTQFGGQVNVTEPPPRFTPPALDFGNAAAIQNIPPRAWLVKRLLMRGAVTVLPAAGATGKTTIGLTIAAHGAVGKDWAGYHFQAPFKTIFYSAEEDRDELSRRLFAICYEYGLDFDQVKSGILLLGSDDVPLDIVNVVNRQPVVNREQVEWLTKMSSRPDVGLVILDPLVELHTCDENDTVQMRFVMSVLRSIARSSSVSVLLPHHTSKVGAMAQGRAGNAEISRGAVSIINSGRVAMTLVGCTEQDREVYGIPEVEKHLYVRLDDAKMNLTLATSQSVWFKKVGVRLFNGDEVGVLKTHNMVENDEHQKKFIALVLAEHLCAAGRATMTIQEAVNVLQSSDPLYDKMTGPAIRAKLERTLMRGVDTDNGSIVWARDEQGLKPVIKIV